MDRPDGGFSRNLRSSGLSCAIFSGLFVGRRQFAHQPEGVFGHGLKVDLWAEREGSANLAIEVRYKTSRLSCAVNGETFDLKEQAAEDQGRCDYWLDAGKLEQVVSVLPGTQGFAVMITNDRRYWDEPARSRNVSGDFMIFDGRIVSGTLKWSENAGKGTIDGREEPVHLRGAYALRGGTIPHLQPTRTGDSGFLRCISPRMNSKKRKPGKSGPFPADDVLQEGTKPTVHRLKGRDCEPYKPAVPEAQFPQSLAGQALSPARHDGTRTRDAPFSKRHVCRTLKRARLFFIPGKPSSTRRPHPLSARRSTLLPAGREVPSSAR